MNKKIIVGIIAFTILLSIILIVILNGNNNKPDEIVVEKPASESVIIKDRASMIKTSKRAVDVIMPEFQNLEDGYESYINNKIYNDLSDVNVYDELTHGLGEEEIGKFTYEASYERYNCDDYLSLVANQYIYLEGAARPRIQKKCYVVNAKENATATLVDIFKDKINYKKAILDEINNQAKEAKIELVGGNGLTSISDTQQFYIKDNKLVIYFEASEISATAVGELEFEMPFEFVDNKFVI